MLRASLAPRSPGAARAALLALLALLAPGCSRDRTVDGHAELLDRQPEMSKVLCDDLTRSALLLAPGASVRSSAVLQERPSVLLAACATEPEGASGNLRVEVLQDGRRPFASSRQVPADRWTELAVALPGSGRGGASITLVAEGATVAVADAFVAQRELRQPRAGAPGALQVLLISVDTLRADALAPYGGPATPAISRLTAESDLWLRHYAASWWTKPSHATLLSGQPPDVHGATGIGSGIAPGLPLLAERLREAGLRTHAVVDDVVNLAPRWGFDRGFEEYVVWNRGLAAGVRHVASWIERHRAEPFFLFFHTFETHSDKLLLPYESPGTSRATLEARLGVPNYGCRGGKCGSRLLRAMAHGALPIRKADRRALPFLYANSVAYLDAQLGELFRRLRDDGTWDGLWVVLTSDHGEELFDHGGLLHRTLHEEIVRVPLIVKPPGGRPAAVHDEPTSALDVAPTLLALAGRRDPRLPGRPLGTRGAREAIVAGYGGRHTVIAGDWKLLTERGEAGGERLFALDDDPRERRDLGAERADLVALLRAELARFQEVVATRLQALGAPAEPATPLTAEERAQLRALGYL